MLEGGTKLGPYEIVAPLGAGGMGEVYRARDTRLDRTVAIKVLPSHLSSDPTRRERFEREAKAISSLNHPHICTLYDIGREGETDYLVMEYVEGETLSARLDKGPLPTEQALRIGVEMADALDKAHRQGITHRDLKPGNIMLTKSGAKLLDFGLAKLVGEGSALPREPGGLPYHGKVGASHESPLHDLPTEGKSLTVEGTILGTFQYMSPEQLEGKNADARSDIFSFGAVLYEMVTGKKAFEGKTTASVIAAVLASEPTPISTLQPMTPPALERLVKKCLAKDPDARWQSAADLRDELKWIAEGSHAGVPAPVIARRRSRERLAWMIAGTLFPLVVGALALVLHLRKPPEQVRAIRFLVAPPEKVTFTWYDLPVVSPDGERLVFVGAAADGQGHLWVRPLNSLTAEMLPGTEGAYFPFWSPDSRSIAFYASGKLKKIDVSGGPPQTLCDVAGISAGGAWNREGVLVFAPTPASPLYRVAAGGGEAKPLTTLDPSRHETSHRWPYFLPDGRHFVYLALSTQQEHRGIYVGSLDSKETRRILVTDTKAVYSPPGFLLFVRGNTLMAQSFDAKKLESAAEPLPVVEQPAQYAPASLAAFSVSENGVLAYQASAGSSKTQLVWFDRVGKRLGPVGEPADYSNPSLSPDDKKVAVGRRDPQTKTRDIWVFDLTRGTSLRVTFDPSDDLNPVWSRDGSRILFTSDRKGHRDIYQKMANGMGADELVLASEDDKSVADWSSDGQFVAYDTGGTLPGAAVWVLPLFGDRKLIPFLRTQFREHQAQFAPDGRWIAYTSDESGKYEVYVQTFPQAGGKWKVSTEGGSEPRWRRDGKELFYLADAKLMAVPVKTDSSTFEPGIPKLLFETRVVGRVVGVGSVRNSYVVTRDGQRFLINTPVEQASSSPITVVVNWTADLKK